MTIIHLILGKARTDRMNGINKVAHNLAVQQGRMGHRVEIWGITPTPESLPPREGYELRLFQAERNKFRLDAELIAAINHLVPGQTVVHIHGSFITEFYLVATRLKRRGISYIYCPHGSLSPGALQRSRLRKKVYFRLFEAWIIRNSRSVHFLGKTQYDAIDKIIKVPHKALIPNGLSSDELLGFRRMTRQDSHPVFSFCGRLDIHHKGLDLLLEGFALYKGEGGKGKLALIGDGTDKGILLRMADNLGILSEVEFLGSRFGDEKLTILGNSDVFIHTSRYEGMPMAVLEAAGLGLPCILSQETNLAGEFAENGCGIALTENQPEQIAKALKEAEIRYESGELGQMGARAATLIRDTYNWKSIAGKVIELYQ